ncbi:MAG: hypothetical protein U1A78_26625 [Polyangia bacterium]
MSARRVPPGYLARFLAHVDAAFPGAEITAATLEELQPHVEKAYAAGQPARLAAASLCACDGGRIQPAPGLDVSIARGAVLPPRGRRAGDLFLPGDLRWASLERLEREIAQARRLQAARTRQRDRELRSAETLRTAAGRKRAADQAARSTETVQGLAAKVVRLSAERDRLRETLEKPRKRAQEAAPSFPAGTSRPCPPDAPGCSLGLMGATCGLPAPLLLAAAAGAPVPRTARYCLTRASLLIPSHDPTKRNSAGGFLPRPDYPELVQERPYDRDLSEVAKVVQVAQQMRPELIFNSNPDAINGPPVVTQRKEDQADGRAIVLGGNGRTMGLQRHYAEGGTAARRYLAEHAEDFGLSRAAVEALPDPVVVRVIETSGQVRELRELVRLLNVSLTEELAQRARASAEAARLSDEAIDILATGLADDRTLAEYLDSRASLPFAAALQRAGILTERNRKLYVSQEGAFTADGKRFVERLLTAAVIQSAPLLDAMPEGLRETISRGAPWVVTAAAYGTSWDLRPDLTLAVEDYRRMRLQGQTDVSAYLAQLDALTPHATAGRLQPERLLRLVAALAAKPLQFGRFAQHYARAARQNVEGQGNLFASEAVSPDQALLDAAALVGVRF